MNKRNSDQDDLFNDDEFSEYEYRRGGGSSSTNLDLSDIDLSALSIAPEEDDLADIEDIIEQQSYENRRVMDGISNIPSGVNLVPDPIDYKGEKPNGDPGDNKRMKGMLALSASLIGVLIIGLIFGSWYNPGDNTSNVVLSGPVTIGDGEVIEPGRIAPQNQTNSGGSTDNTDVRVPEGGSLVNYRIEVEGDINAISLAYVTGSGDQDSVTGVTSFPWSKSVGMRSSVNPQFAVNSSGYGTVTCIITQDGEKVAEKTVSGEKPQVECA